MSRFQDLKDFFERRLLAAVIREQRTTYGYEEELQRQRKLLDVILIPEIKLHRADVQQLMVKKEELPPEQQERSPYPDQEDKESPLIKEEQVDNETPLIKEEPEELWIDQGREQLQGLEEAETKFLFPSVHVKSESDEEEPQSSLLHQRLTDHMETSSDGEDCERPESARSSHPKRNLQPEVEVKVEASSDSGSETEDGIEDCTETRDHLDINERAETVMSHNWAEPDETNQVVSLKEKRPFICSECGKAFKKRRSRTLHMIVHSKEKPYSCSECGKGFKRKQNLASHIFVHTKEKPFSCPICGKEFTRKNLTTHMYVHSKERPYSCSGCGKAFRRKQQLREHMFVHSNEKPYSCSECDKAFTRQKYLTIHMFSHVKEKHLSCSECGKRFKHNRSLTAHMYLHTTGKPHRCLACGKGYFYKLGLARHCCSKMKATSHLL